MFSFQLEANVFSDFFIQKKAHDAYQLKNFEQAESVYTRLLANDPYDAQNNYNLGCVLHKEKKFDDAQNYFNRAIEHVKPDSKLQEQALFNRGNNFAALKKFDDAIADYKKVLKINAENVAAKKNLKACEQMKKEQQKQEQQQKQKDKNKNQDQKKDSQNQDSPNQDSSNQDSPNQDSNSSDSDHGSDQNQQSSTDQSKKSKKEPKGKQKKQEKNKSQDQQGDTEQDSQEKEQNKEKQEDGLQKSKKQKSEDKQSRKEQKQQEMKHEKSSQLSQQKQSTKSEQNGKEVQEQKVELNDAYAKEMMTKPSDDNRLEKRSAMLLEKLDDYEKNIQKKLLQMNVTKQGAQKHGQKNW